MVCRTRFEDHVYGLCHLATNSSAVNTRVGVTSEEVGSGVADCDLQNIRNPWTNCGSFVDATSSES